jgi:cysteinyl-tRNA synthetase
MISGYEAQLNELRNKLAKDQKKIAKMEQKLSVGTKGYQLKMSKLVAGMNGVNSVVTQLQHAGVELACFTSLYQQEHDYNVAKRLADAKSFTEQAEAIEASLQKKYEASRMQQGVQCESHVMDMTA